MSFLLSSISASAVLVLPTPEITSEEVASGKVNIKWQFQSEDAPQPIYHVVVYKKHIATQDETFVLAQSNFDYIESTGTMKKHQERGATWDYLPDNPGWYAKFPLYMNGAMGIDTYQYFAGSDNDDVFGGSYLISSDYDLSDLSNPNINLECEMAHEANSVIGGYGLYTYNTEDWWDEKNIDYKGIVAGAVEHSDLSDETWKNYQSILEPDAHLSRTRICFYGSGYSALWLNSFKASVEMKAGESVTYPVEFHRLTNGETEFSINTETDTETDQIYAYQVLASREDYDDYRQITTIRFMSAMNKPMKVIGEDSNGIDEALNDFENISVNAANGAITVNGADKAEVYTIDGKMIYNGSTSNPIAVQNNGLYIVRAANQSVKVIL